VRGARSLVVVLIVVLTVLTVAGEAPVSTGAGGDGPVRLRSGPLPRRPAATAARLRVVTLSGGRVAELAHGLTRCGVRVLAYLPDRALLVTGSPSALTAVGSMGGRQWAWEPALAVTPELRMLARGATAVPWPRVPIIARVVAGDDAAAFLATLTEAGFSAAWTQAGRGVVHVGMLVEPARVEELLSLLDQTRGLVTADLQPPVRLRNAASAWRCQSGRPNLTPVFSHGLHGEGQIVGIMDTGIDQDSCFFWDNSYRLPALNDDISTAVDTHQRKVLAVDFYWGHDWPDPSAADWDSNGHGTHVAGSVAGDTGNRGTHEGNDGMAPAARLVIQDGRIKPDVVAPGMSVVSAADDFMIGTFNCGVRSLSGTSMACPTAAGLAALMRQYFASGFYPAGEADPARGFEPSAALVKAMLIASAVDLSTEGCENVRPIPSRDQGWGEVRLERALHFAGDDDRLLVDDHHGGFVADGSPGVMTGVRTTGAGSLRAVLAWTDPPSTSLAAVNLVNDLDLVVSGPDGTFRGNVFSGGVSVTGGTADRLNNVEVVWLPTTSAGRWTVSVAPHAVNLGPQDYALVITGGVEPVPPRRARRRAVPAPSPALGGERQEESP